MSNDEAQFLVMLEHLSDQRLRIFLNDLQATLRTGEPHLDGKPLASAPATNPPASSAEQATGQDHPGGQETPEEASSTANEP